MHCLSYVNVALGTASTQSERTSVLKFAGITFDHKETEIHDLEVEAGVIDALTIHLGRALKKDQKDAERLCKLLTLVYQCSDEVTVQSFIKVGATLVPYIFKLLSKYRPSETESKYAGRLLQRLSSVAISLQSVKNKEEILAFLLKTIRSAQDSNNTMVNHALSLLAGMSICRKSKEIAMKFPGLFDTVVDVGCSQDVETRHQSARVLSKLAWHVKTRTTMGRTQKCVDVLITMSFSSYQHLQSEALTALQLLSIESENKQKLVTSKKEKLVQSLMDVIDVDAGGHLRLQALCVLLNLISRETFKSIGSHPGLINSLAALTTSSKESETIASLAAQCIKRLATYMQVKEKYHEDLLRAIVDMSHCDRKTVMLWASKALLDQSALSSNSFYIVRDQDAMRSLVHLMSCPHRNVKESALETVVNLSENKSNAKKLASSNQLVGALVNSIDDQPCSDETILRQHAVRAILSLVSHRASTKRIAKHMGLVAALSRYGIAAQDNDVELKRAALHGVILLAPFL